MRLIYCAAPLPGYSGCGEHSCGENSGTYGSVSVKTFAIIVVVLAGIGGLAAGAGWWFVRGPSPGDLATSVRTERVGRGELVELVPAPGQVQPRTKVSISARVSARIAELPFEEGQVVTKGDPSANPPIPASVLLKLDSKDLEAELRSAEARRAGEAEQLEVSKARILAQVAQIKSTEVQLADAERNLRRQKQLFESRDVSQATVEDAQAKVDTFRAQISAARQDVVASETGLRVMQHQLEAAEAGISKARDALSYTTIASPINGVVTKLNAKAGEMVVTGTMNNPGTVILEVADLEHMLMVARLDETSVASVAPGQRALVRMQAYNEELFEGVVEKVALVSTDEKDGSRYYRTDILLTTNGRRIYSGLTADAEIQTKRHENVMRVPSQAVVGRSIDELPADLRSLSFIDRTKPFTTVVYRVVNDKAIVTPVKIGASDLTHTIVEAGLSDADIVVTGPFKVLESIKHDQQIKLETPATQPATQPSTQPATKPS